MKVTEKKNPDGTIELTAVAATAEVAQAFNVAHHSFLANIVEFHERHVPTLPSGCFPSLDYTEERPGIDAGAV